MPRPWLLAAVTGVPMAALLRQAEEEATERSEEALPGPLPEEHVGSLGGGRATVRAQRDNVVRLRLPS